jgi:hypothetical protein
MLARMLGVGVVRLGIEVSREFWWKGFMTEVMGLLKRKRIWMYCCWRVKPLVHGRTGVWDSQRICIGGTCWYVSKSLRMGR